jgi:hypothetical protein
MELMRLARGRGSGGMGDVYQTPRKPLPFLIRAHIAVTTFNFLYVPLVLIPMLVAGESTFPKDSITRMSIGGWDLYHLDSPARGLVWLAMLVYPIVLCLGPIFCAVLLNEMLEQWRNLTKHHQHLLVILQALSWPVLTVAWMTAGAAASLLYN